MLAIAAARAFATFQAGNQPFIDRRTYGLLGTLLPVLEGLALYAELDYRGDEDRDVIHSPLLKTSHFTALAMRGIEGDAQFLAIRSARLYKDKYLHALLIEPAIAPNEHAYLSGYLYIKAVARYLQELCPEAAHPSFLLPLLIRIFCDHAVIVNSQLEDIAPVQILGAIQKSIFLLRKQTISMLSDWVQEDQLGDVVQQFDALDIFKTDRAGTRVFRGKNERWWYQLGCNRIEWLPQLRVASSYLVAASATGKLVTVDASSLTLKMNGETTKFSMLSAADFERASNNALRRQASSVLARKVQERLQQSIGETLTIALCLDIALGHPAMAYWKDQVLVSYTPYSLEALGFPEERQRMSLEAPHYGLAIPPERRLQFEDALHGSEAMAPAVVEASEWTLTQLVSSVRLRRSIMQQKLAALHLGRHLPSFYRWSETYPLTELPEEVEALLDPVFDLPAFRKYAAGKGLRFRHLVPQPCNL
jgi:hypothetical protein